MLLGTSDRGLESITQTDLWQLRFRVRVMALRLTVQGLGLGLQGLGFMDRGRKGEFKKLRTSVGSMGKARGS